MSEEKVKTADYSVTGQNRYILWCDPMMQKRCYGTCATLIESYKEGRLKPEGSVFNDCAMAMSKGLCSAMAMREEEVEKNQSIYFKEPGQGMSEVKAKVDKKSPSYARGWNQVKGSKTEDMPIARLPAGYNGAKPGKVPEHYGLSEDQIIARKRHAAEQMNIEKEEPKQFKQEYEAQFVDIDLGKVVTDLAGEESKPVEEAPQTSGESMLDIARRIAAEKRSA